MAHTLTLLVGALLLQGAMASPVLFHWLNLPSPAVCCRRKLANCCPLINLPVEHAAKRPWPLFTNEGLTPEEIEKRNKERRARRERHKDRQRDRDSRRQHS
ncbi:uncharacterized protein LOC125028848 [Penaeus chinensis]|uniref:uncharacterized protein LOC125028848 n=1 Tax=Penaeus chinensis TaxID=139456 RepID=UPI001FB806E7|nr:uncharacterized protein LOC125028848 [Penaeus chinensis]